MRTKNLIIEHKQDIDKFFYTILLNLYSLATALLEKETLDLQKIIDILGERPFEPRSNYKAYLDLKRTEKKELLEEEEEEAAK